MPQIPDKEPSHSAQKRVQAFLECIAQLLAKRWLREQREQEKRQAKPPETQDPER